MEKVIEPIMNPGEREENEQHLLMTRSKYLTMTEEDVRKLTPQDQEGYQKTFKINRRRYSLINHVNFSGKIYIF